MIVALAGSVILIVAVFAWLLDRKDGRAAVERDGWIDRLVSERDAHRREVDGLAQRVHVAYGAHRAEVADLLQRIQAPERAVLRHDDDMPVAPAPAPDFSDDEYWKQQEAIAELERMERQEFEKRLA